MERVRAMRIGRGERAPRKPLLLLFALGRFQRDGGAPIPFATAEDPVDALLHRFASAQRYGGAHHPFHHLANDDRLWTVETPQGPGSPGPSARTLRSSRATGRLHPELLRELAADPGLPARLVRFLLAEHFPAQQHADICREVGLDPAQAA
ncbi:hypothetical protein CLV72_103289 [Allonocardiopsis opalescens]|uniref:ScoMcrA-like DNA sulfur-binding domain-containing protein n=2 Tax=Allonocardiopsis opalescens TaxID=1144618 RepID=A0A2T0Q7A8_9ACTN|nr:hypothetical protein CLV72_103289 [Allonocardiopsis opalescens]